MRRSVFIALLLLLTASGACATLGTLGRLVQPPRFAEAPDRDAEVRLEAPSAERPLGGAVIRIYTEVSNPNPFGLTLRTLTGSLRLDGQHAADADFPLGLPLDAGGSAVVPLDLAISFSDLPGLMEVVRRAARNERVDYQLEGTIGVDAGTLGEPVFGPMTLLRGELGR